MTERFTLPSDLADLADRLACGGAVAWSEQIVIPTYATGAPETLPIFSESRVYQAQADGSALFHR